MEKPDFRELAKQNFAIVDENGKEVGDKQPYALRQGFGLGCEHVWSSHVEPLQKENEKIRKIITESHTYEELMTVTAERDKLKSENERLKKHLNEIKDDRSNGTNSNYTDPEAGRQSGWSV